MTATLPPPPHPREVTSLVGHAETETAFARAHADGRLHHAWLLGGNEGIGKATLAYRMARFLLAPSSERTGSGLAVAPDGRTARQVAARSHPNLLVLERAAGEGDKAAPKTIPVEAVRKVLGFFGTTAADGGHRVCIVDTVDDLNANGVNALLKTIEEPPARATVLLVSHAPRRVLPTVRSRCTRVALAGLSPDEIARAIRGLGPAFAALPPDEAAAAAAAAEGSVGRALAMTEPRRRALLAELGALLDRLPEAPAGRVLALADRLADRKAEDELGLALDAILRWVSGRVRAGAAGGARRLAPLAEVCDKLAADARAVESYNLDRRPFVIAMFGDLAEAVRLAA